MSRVHPVFGISLEETAPAFPTSRHDSGAAGTNAASVSTEFLESESHTDVASAPFSGDASTFGGPAKSPGRPEDVAAPPQDGSWGPLRLPTPPTEVSEPAPVPASMLELVRTTDRTLIAIIALVGGVLILFVLNQAVAFIDHLAQSPAWAQWIGGMALLVALAAIVGSMWSLAQRYWQLKQTPAVCLQRRQLHELVCSNTTQAKHKLEELLREFPIDRDPSGKWKRLGFTPEMIQSLTAARAQLLNPRHGVTNKWLEEFRTYFLGPLDVAAQQRVKHFAKRVGLKTAIAPAGFLDSAIVIVNSYLLLADLCDIYNVRAGRMGTLRLLIRVAFNTSVAGNLDQPTEVLEQELRESILDWTGSLVAHVVGTVAAKAAEGGANALLVYRLGQATIRELRPLRPLRLK